jgi:hypothetical protein
MHAENRILWENYRACYYDAGRKKYETTEFQYNTLTRQAIAFNARTEESEGVITANKTKKYNDSIFAMSRRLYNRRLLHQEKRYSGRLFFKKDI